MRSNKRVPPRTTLWARNGVSFFICCITVIVKVYKEISPPPLGEKSAPGKKGRLNLPKQQKLCSPKEQVVRVGEVRM